MGTELKNRKGNKQKDLSDNQLFSNKETVIKNEEDTNKWHSESIISKTNNLINNSGKQQGSSQLRRFKLRFEVDLISLCLFLISFVVRMYRLGEPRHIVFDELHYGKYVSLYMKRIFFFDSHPPLGKQLISLVAYFAGFDGNFKFDRIGTIYTEDVPLIALRFIPAFCGSLLAPSVYHIVLESGLAQSSAVLGGFLIFCDNALLTQSRFILMEPMLLLFSLLAVLCMLKFCKYKDQPYSSAWFLWLGLTFFSATGAVCVKFSGIYTWFLCFMILLKNFWNLLGCDKYSDGALLNRFFIQMCVVLSVSSFVYISVFYMHLNILNKAGPHDTVMTSAFQASLEGGLASITKGQPLIVGHGSQITLRHTHGRSCWLHSHPHVYPVRYQDKRGSSHQQQVTCYSFKDVNNWWIVKRPDRNDLVVGDGDIDMVRDGDVIQLVHGMTSRALNSHDVAAPMSPQCQEVSCYIDYNVSMPAQNLWRVELTNSKQTNGVWHTIQSHVRLIHVSSNQALRFTGRQLPDWGFNQHEVVTDKIIQQDDAIWNVEEHRYTKTEDQKERERQMVNAEMIPMLPTKLSFWRKFEELHHKMLLPSSSSNVDQPHMYGSDPVEWPLMNRGIAYWVSSTSNAQIHLLGNILLWYSATASLLIYNILLIFYLLRRRRQCYDLPPAVWDQFITTGELFMGGYLFHYLPYLFVDRVLFLHHYLPALLFKVLMIVAVVEHIHYVLVSVLNYRFMADMLSVAVIVWAGCVVFIFKKFIVLSYGFHDLTTADVLDLRWKDTWDFIIHRN